MIKKLQLLIFLPAFLFCKFTSAQFIVPYQGTDTVYTCSGTLKDRINTQFGYLDDVNGTLIIYPTTPGYKIKLTFSQFSTDDNSDYLEIWSGIGNGGQLIGKYFFANSPGTVYSGDSSGAITLHFFTDWELGGLGFEAAIECIAPSALPDLFLYKNLESNLYNQVSSYQICNNGKDTTAISCHTFLSTDGFIDGADLLLEIDSNLSIGENKSAISPIYNSYPPNTVPGNYYSIINIENQNVVTENNESNNTMALPILVDSSFIDLVGINVYTQDPFLAGDMISVEVSAYNMGNNDLHQSINVGIYLSLNYDLDANDIKLGSLPMPRRSSFYYSNYNVTNNNLLIPNSLSPGIYQLIAVIDDSLLITESNEKNNSILRPITLVKNNLDLFLNKASISKLNTAPGGNVKVSYYPVQFGTNANPGSTDSYYLSVDSILDASDIPLMSQSASNPYWAKNAILQIPSSALTGNYYIIIKLDGANAIAETDENNNTYSIHISVDTPFTDLKFYAHQSGNYRCTNLQGYAITTIFYNAGNVPFDSTRAGYFISLDKQLDSTDNLITYRKAAPLQSFEKTDVSLLNWSIPGWLPYGKYYILTVIDALDSVQESNEFNNILVDSILVVAPENDWTIDSYHTNIQNTIKAGDSMNVTIVLRNLENHGPNTGFTTNYYLSKKSHLDTSATLLFSSATQAFLWLKIPTNTLPGVYYFLAYCDYGNVIAETNENNNEAAFPIYVYSGTLTHDSIPDMGHDTLTTCNSYLSDYDINISNGILTINPGVPGNHIAIQSIDLSYLINKFDLYDGPDTSAPLIEKLSEEDLDYSGTYYSTNSSGTLTILCNGHSSWEYSASYSALISCVDSVPACDLELKTNYYNYNNKARPGGQVRLIFSALHNKGGFPAASANVGYYFSMDDTLDSSDIFLDSTSVGKMIGGKSIQFEKYVQLPLTLSSGLYYIFAKTDFSNAIPEPDEQNNIARFTILINTAPSDLELTNLTFSSINLTNCPYYINFDTYLNNNGNLTEDSSWVGLFLSPDNQLDSTDTFIGKRYVELNIPANSIQQISIGFNVPLTIAPGIYFVFSVADYTHRLNESNELNNAVSFPIRLAPRYSDLVTLSGNVLYYNYNNSKFCRIDNFASADVGNYPIYSGKTAVYLSSDSLFDAGDVFLDTVFSISNSTFYLDSLVSPGNYYLITELDFRNQDPESDETNNLLAMPFIVPDTSNDLAFYWVVDKRKTCVAGNEIGVTGIYKNKSANQLSNLQVGVYLSSDTLIDSADIKLLSTRGNYFFAGMPIIPRGTVQGNYYLIFKVDDNDSIPETDESNNSTYLPLYVYPSQVDLTFNTTTLSNSAVAAGYTLVANAEVYNHSNNKVKSSKVGFYLSNDTLFDTGDLFLTHSFDTPIEAGSYSYKNTQLTIPSSTTNGNYFILFFVDDSSQVNEDNESNNIRAIPIIIGAPIVDLSIKAPSLSNIWLLAGSIINSSLSIENLGNIYSSSSNLTYFFSKDTLVDSLDILLSVKAGSALAAGVSEIRNQAITIPTQADTGNYFILFIADYSGLLAESNELNNKGYVAINISLVGIKEQIPVEDITISPNPFRSKIKIEFGNNFMKSITVFDISGRIIYQKKEILESSSEINTANWAEGIYFIDIKQDQKAFRKKLIKLN